MHFSFENFGPRWTDRNMHYSPAEFINFQNVWSSLLDGWGSMHLSRTSVIFGRLFIHQCWIFLSQSLQSSGFWYSLIIIKNRSCLKCFLSGFIALEVAVGKYGEVVEKLVEAAEERRCAASVEKKEALLSMEHPGGNLIPLSRACSLLSAPLYKFKRFCLVESNWCYILTNSWPWWLWWRRSSSF